MGGEGERADRQTTWAQGCVGRGVQSLTKTGLKTTPPPTEHSCQTKIKQEFEPSALATISQEAEKTKEPAE